MDSPKVPDSRNTRPRINSDVIVAIVLLLICAGFYAVTLTFRSGPSYASTQMGPEGFPQIVLGIIALLSVLLFYFALRAPAERFEPVGWPPVLTLVLLVVLVLLLSVLGAIVLPFAAFVGFSIVWRQNKIVLPLAVAAAVAVFTEFVLVRTLHLRLPTGMILPYIF